MRPRGGPKRGKQRVDGLETEVEFGQQHLPGVLAERAIPAVAVAAGTAMQAPAMRGQQRRYRGQQRMLARAQYAFKYGVDSGKA